METGKNTKAASLKGFLRKSYKNLQLLYFVTVLLNFLHESNFNH